MKITRRQLRKIISEAITRLPVFEPVSREEIRSKLGQKRAHSRSIADIDPVMLSKINTLEAQGGALANQARSFAQALGSKSPAEDVTYQQEDEYADNMIRQSMGYYLGPGVKLAEIDHLKKMASRLDHYKKSGKPIEVWIFEGANYFRAPSTAGYGDPEKETVASLSDALRNEIYYIHSYGFGIGDDGGAGSFFNYDYGEYQDFLDQLHLGGSQPVDYYIFETLVHFVGKDKIIIKSAM
jgi:hypothetical protein